MQTDGYSAYNKLGSQITQVGCWAHSRRKFDEAVKAQAKGKRSGKAQLGLSQILKLYAIEKQIADKPAEARQQHRQQLAKPAIEKMHVWLMKSITEVPPTSKTGKALVYLKNQWPSLLHYFGGWAVEHRQQPSRECDQAICFGQKKLVICRYTGRGSCLSSTL